MRVIAGKARRIPLETIEGLDTRPTTDRIKETLFNMIQNDLYGCSFLDLFSGSGAIGIEALSRGCEDATFIESNPKAITCINNNLKKTKLDSMATVIARDVITAINQLQHQSKSFDIIFMDPPYNMQWEQKVLEEIAGTGLIKDNGLIIVEASLDSTFDYVEQFGFSVEKYKQYKTNQHVFIRKKLTEC